MAMSIMKITKRLLLGLTVAAWPAACSSDDGGSGSSGGGSESCIMGAQDACTCEDGSPGARLCGADSTYGECVCSSCGNGTLEASEECDGANVNGQTCASATMNARPTGLLSCSASACTFDTSGCTAPATGGTTGAGGTLGGGGTIGGGGTGVGGLMGP